MLTDRQERFVLGLIKGKSQRDAYKAAFSTAKMKDKTIDEKACRLFADSKIRARYDELRGKVLQPEQDKAIATAQQVLEELTAIGLGTKNFPAYDMFGNEAERKPSVTARLKALELLAKRHGLLTDHVQINGVMPVQIVDDLEELEVKDEE